MPGYTLTLNLQGSKPATLHNGNGVISLGVTGSSYYYSRTRMAVTGTIVDHNQSLRVQGQAWMDHQWGDFLTLTGSGWDWYSIQLNNNSEMMLYFIRDASGKVTATYGDYIDGDGNGHLLAATSLHASVLCHWTSPKSGIAYPSGWQLAISDPLVQATLTVTPLLKDQELLAYQSTGNSYWEGAVSIQGQSAGHAVQGEGYVELTGYGK
jgi:predicted secreted hydrolase